LRSLLDAESVDDFHADEPTPAIVFNRPNNFSHLHDHPTVERSSTFYDEPVHIGLTLNEAYLAVQSIGRLTGRTTRQIDGNRAATFGYVDRSRRQ
jgi:hypothetical protein